MCEILKNKEKLSLYFFYKKKKHKEIDRHSEIGCLAKNICMTLETGRKKRHDDIGEVYPTNFKILIKMF